MAWPTTSTWRPISRGVTTTVAETLRPPAEACTIYVPGRSATNAPSEKTCAPSPATDQVMPPLALPCEVDRTAAKWRTSPVFVEAFAGEMATDLTCSFPTVTLALADLPSPAARIFALPGFIACITPAASTLAIPGESEAQVSAMSVRGSPLELQGGARIGATSPAESSVAGRRECIFPSS